MPIDDDAVGIVKWGTGAGASDFNTPADVGFAEADGWPLAYGTPGSGSEPQREVFNWQWRQQSALAVELLTHGGGLPWDSRISYLHPASVMGSDGMLYQSVQDSTNQDPTTDTSNTHWQQVGIMLSDADIKTAYERNADTNALTNALLTRLQDAAPLASPSFTGAVTVPDQTAGTNNGRAANTRFVAAALAALVASAPSTLDTLNELADALGDDPNFAATVMTMLDNRPDNDAVIDLIRRNALSGPKVVLQNTALNYATGGTAVQQGLAFPGSSDQQWLDSSKIEVKSFAPLGGCSKVTGGIYFDWDDSDISSVDAIFTANWRNRDPTTDQSDATFQYDVVSTSSFMSDSDWIPIAASGHTTGDGDSSLRVRSKAVRVPRNGYLLFSRVTAGDDEGYDNFSIEMEVLQINT